MPTGDIVLNRDASLKDPGALAGSGGGGGKVGALRCQPAGRGG
jgi:hypothetical protein